MRQRRFAHAWDVLDQQMAAGQQRDHGQFDHGALALDDPFNVGLDRLDFFVTSILPLILDVGNRTLVKPVGKRKKSNRPPEDRQFSLRTTTAV